MRSIYTREVNMKLNSTATNYMIVHVYKYTHTSTGLLSTHSCTFVQNKNENRNSTCTITMAIHILADIQNWANEWLLVENSTADAFSPLSRCGRSLMFSCWSAGRWWLGRSWYCESRVSLLSPCRLRQASLEYLPPWKKEKKQAGGKGKGREVREGRKQGKERGRRRQENKKVKVTVSPNL